MHQFKRFNYFLQELTFILFIIINISCLMMGVHANKMYLNRFLIDLIKYDRYKL